MMTCLLRRSRNSRFRKVSEIARVEHLVRHIIYLFVGGYTLCFAAIMRVT